MHFPRHARYEKCRLYKEWDGEEAKLEEEEEFSLDDVMGDE
jgi:hypothetical protein